MQEQYARDAGLAMMHEHHVETMFVCSNISYTFLYLIRTRFMSSGAQPTVHRLYLFSFLTEFFGSIVFLSGRFALLFFERPVSFKLRGCFWRKGRLKSLKAFELRIKLIN